MRRDWAPPRYPLATPAELRVRQERPELLDMNSGTLSEAATSLEDLARINARLWGLAATLDPLKPRLLAAPKPVTVLDLGTGSGQLARSLAEWAAREHVALRIVAVDLNPRHLAIAAADLRPNRKASPPRALNNGVQLLGASAIQLPLADGSVDFVISSLLLHHFEPSGLSMLLAECRRVARRGLVMTDLVRHPVPYLIFRLVVRPLLVRSPITVHDSEASFRRGYTLPELRSLAAQILPSPRVRIHPLALRLVLTSEWGN